MQDTLVTATDERFVEYLREYAGTALRGVVRYTDGDCSILYLRNDVASLYGDVSNTSEINEILQDVEAIEQRQAERLQVGDHHATLRLYDDAVALHFPQGPDVGTVVSLDPDVARDLTSFLGGCLERLARDSPQEIDRAPRW